MAAKSKKSNKSAGAKVQTGQSRTIAENRKARHRYEITEQIECGIVLVGSEVKSLRNGKISLDEAYVRFQRGALWLIGANIAAYSQAGIWNHEYKRPRKLLVHRKQLTKLEEFAFQKGLTLVPLRVYFNSRGLVKLIVGVGRGKKLHDKRETKKKADVKRHIDREMQTAISGRDERTVKEKVVRQIRYAVAMSLDGYIAGPNGEYDWILMDPEIDFQAFTDRFDTILVGRRTFEPMVAAGNANMPGMKTVLFSTTLKATDYPEITVVGSDYAETLNKIRGAPGKDIWLFGGGALFRSLAQDGLVDIVEVAVIPVLLGGGIPLLPPPADVLNLRLTSQKVYKQTGTVMLNYAIKRE